MRLKSFLPFLALVVVATTLPAFAVEHAVAGTVTKVDSRAKTISVKLADGTEEVIKFTEHTAVRAARAGGAMAKKGAAEAALAGKEGSDVIVHYTGEGADKTATAVDDFGKQTLKTSQGTVTKTDKAAHTITIKAEDGTEHTYRVAKDASIDTEHGVVKGSEYDAKKVEKLTVHYTEEAGHKVLHFVKQL